jgi:hypothetical protein
MTASSRLLLIGATGLATQPAPTVLPSAYSFLYTAGAPSCMDLAARIGDRLWLTPRLHPGLDAPDSWQELLLSHRNHGVIGIVPDGALADGYSSAEASALELRFDRARRTLELSLRAGPL